MERLFLNDFKMKSENTQELESLTGGVLGTCHVDYSKPGMDLTFILG